MTGIDYSTFSQDKLLAEGAQRKNDKQSTDTAVTSSGSPPQMVVKPDVPSSGSPPQMVIKPDVPSSGSPPQMVVKPDVPSSQEQTTGITAVPQTELPEVTSGDHSATQTSGGSQSQQRSSVGQRRKPHSRPATKPIPMSGQRLDVDKIRGQFIVEFKLGYHCYADVFPQGWSLVLLRY